MNRPPRATKSVLRSADVGSVVLALAIPLGLLAVPFVVSTGEASLLALALFALGIIGVLFLPLGATLAFVTKRPRILIWVGAYALVVFVMSVGGPLLSSVSRNLGRTVTMVSSVVSLPYPFLAVGAAIWRFAIGRKAATKS